ncbi:thiazole biosynthesis adenylyltransferase ThiF [Ectobacillus sp. sgz5001026]|uniref:thiazole biosynthesis adenylyltransferase ThiF n=1 Tax=Ectobacillus sp. sgz5001026 TaxID=3242473 RepID=UPI0036D24FF9
MISRYSRQILFSPIGDKGQELLREKHVLVIGAGALGSGNAEMLARAGVGKLTIVDRDYIDWSNLQRQQLYVEQDAINHLPKAIAAKTRLEQINHEVEIAAYVTDVTAESLEDFSRDVDVIVDATDNFEIRFLINDISQKHRIPWVYGACVGSYGLSYTIVPGETPCLHCLLQSIPLGGATCDTNGIIAPAVSQVVSYQVTETLKLLVGDHKALRRNLVSFDLWNNEHTSLDVQRLRKADCPSCGMHASYPYLKKENESKTTVLCGRNTVQIRNPHRKNVDLQLYKKTLQGTVQDLLCNEYVLAFSTEDKRLVMFRDGRVMVHGTKDLREAKSIYHRYFG